MSSSTNDKIMKKAKKILIVQLCIGRMHSSKCTERIPGLIVEGKHESADIYRKNHRIGLPALKSTVLLMDCSDVLISAHTICEPNDEITRATIVVCL